VLPGFVLGAWRIKRPRAIAGRVSIVIPTRAAGGRIETCISSIRELTDYRDFEIVCIDSIPDDNPAAKNWLARNADRVVQTNEAFNWARYNNLGAAAATGAFLLFLNDDTEIRDPDWLTTLLDYAQRPGVGVVGPQLLYPDGKVLHAGMFFAGSVGRHAFRFAARDEPGPFGLALTDRNVTAVTGACMLVQRATYDAVGGFAEEHAVINNDMDSVCGSRATGSACFTLRTPG
jgi:GT2 family glycosyltransferase